MSSLLVFVTIGLDDDVALVIAFAFVVESLSFLVVLFLCCLLLFILVCLFVCSFAL